MTKVTWENSQKEGATHFELRPLKHSLKQFGRIYF